MARKQLPVGQDNFRALREDDCYLVDKTLLIKELLDHRAVVTLITRPRRFGKTLNMTMLREFFDRTTDSRALFAGLKIMETEYAKDLNSRPVLFFSFSDCKGSKEELLSLMFGELEREYLRVSALPELSSRLKVHTEKKRTELGQALARVPYSPLQVHKAIFLLSQILYEYYGQRAIILIDEYDTPMTSAYVEGYYSELRGFFRPLYSTALKGNPYLEMAVLTGVQRIAKESIFSDLNNLRVCTVIDKRFSKHFGFTEQETAEALEAYGLELNEEVKKMYNGYNFAGWEIYNPWSILYYADERALNPWWLNTGGNALLRQSLAKADALFYRSFEKLIEHRVVEVPLKLGTSYYELPNAATLWGLLMNAGYITLAPGYRAGSRILPVRVPNDEVKEEFQEMAAQYAGISDNSLLTMFDSLLKRDIPKFIEIYRDIVLEYTSFHDATHVKTDDAWQYPPHENPYHMLMLGMCVYLDNHYDIESNRERGHGRPDIVLRAKDPGKHINVVIEFKRGEASDLKALAKEALEQIKQRQYAAGLTGQTLLLGIAHDIKRCESAGELS